MLSPLCPKASPSLTSRVKATIVIHSLAQRFLYPFHGLTPKSNRSPYRYSCTNREMLTHRAVLCLLHNFVNAKVLLPMNSLRLDIKLRLRKENSFAKCVAPQSILLRSTIVEEPHLGTHYCLMRSPTLSRRHLKTNSSSSST